MSNCPLCGEAAFKVIYLGLPMRLCADEECGGLFGFWSNVVCWLPIGNEEGEFVFLAYSGSYLPALWHWLTSGDDE